MVYSIDSVTDDCYDGTAESNEAFGQLRRKNVREVFTTKIFKRLIKSCMTSNVSYSRHFNVLLYN